MLEAANMNILHFSCARMSNISMYLMPSLSVYIEEILEGHM